MRNENRIIKTSFRCFVGEIYLLGKASYSKCQPCRTFSYIFYYLIEKIPYRIGVYKWSTPIEKWETDFRYTVKKGGRRWVYRKRYRSNAYYNVRLLQTEHRSI